MTDIACPPDRTLSSQMGNLGTWTEERAPHPHDRRAFFDRYFVVAAHPHRQLGGFDALCEHPQATEERARIRVIRRYRHEAFHREPGAPGRLDERGGRARRAPALLGLAADVHLDEDARAR